MIIVTGVFYVCLIAVGVLATCVVCLFLGWGAAKIFDEVLALRLEILKKRKEQEVYIDEHLSKRRPEGGLEL